MVAFDELFRKVGLAGGADPYFIPLLPIILDRYQESGKAESVKIAAEKAAKQLIRLAPAELAPKVIEELFAVIEGGAKWRSKVGALELLSTFAVSAKDQVAERLGEYVPRLSGAMRDTKPEVSFFRNLFSEALFWWRFFVLQRRTCRACVGMLADLSRAGCAFVCLLDCRWSFQDRNLIMSRSHQPGYSTFRSYSRQMYGRPRNRPRSYQGSLLHCLGS